MNLEQLLPRLTERLAQARPRPMHGTVLSIRGVLLLSLIHI